MDDPGIAAVEIESHLLPDDGAFPNSRLPLLVYRGALALPRWDAQGAIEKLLEGNGWSNCWRGGVYAYDHYHSTTHEVLVCFRGWARVRFGGPHGILAGIKAGDAVAIPAGVAHKNLDCDRHFGVVGAYPGGGDWDLCYGQADERPAADERIARVRLPEADPIYGASGPLIEQWRG